MLAFRGNLLRSRIFVYFSSEKPTAMTPMISPRSSLMG